MNLPFRELVRQSPPPIVVGVWSILIISLMAFLFWVKHFSEREENRRAALVYQVEGSFDRPPVARCLASQLPLTGPDWRSVDQQGKTWRNDNAARHLRVDLVDGINLQRIDIFTRDAQPLRAQEINAVRRCLGLAGKQK
ncbi:hypothetical protein [Sphingobium sp.]|uniref:hypothetical protein n=1 Tax=Sphingobium sp. TaxID=1912891 RepID=UPI003B3AC769